MRIDVRILFPNGAVSATVATTDAGVTITPSTLTTDGTVERMYSGKHRHATIDRNGRRCRQHKHGRLYSTEN